MFIVKPLLLVSVADLHGLAGFWLRSNFLKKCLFEMINNPDILTCKVA